MKAKLLIIGLVSTQEVATFRSVAEAFHCGSLLQASTEDKGLNYYVEYKEKGKEYVQAVDAFKRRLPFLNKATQADVRDYIMAQVRLQETLS